MSFWNACAWRSVVAAPVALFLLARSSVRTDLHSLAAGRDGYAWLPLFAGQRAAFVGANVVYTLVVFAPVAVVAAIASIDTLVVFAPVAVLARSGLEFEESLTRRSVKPGLVAVFAAGVSLLH